MILNIVGSWPVQRIKYFYLIGKFVEEFFDFIHLSQLFLLILVLRLTTLIDVFVNVSEVPELIGHLVFELLVDRPFCSLRIDFVIVIFFIWVDLLAFG